MKMQKKREKTELLESSEKTTEIVNHRITTQKLNENAKKERKTELLESSEKTTEIVNHGITTQKFNENAKKRKNRIT